MREGNRNKAAVLGSIIFASMFLSVPAIFAENMKTYTSEDLGFSFQYPSSWVVSPTTTPNSKAKISSPKGINAAGCAVIVKDSPRSAEASQEEIDQYLFTEPLSTSAIKNGMGQSVNDVEVIASSVGTLGTHRAFLTRTRFRINSGFSEGRTATALTPGKTWTLSCGGDGQTMELAQNSFQFWQSSINNVFFSIKFK